MGIHFRDVVGGPESFVETFQDERQTDMAAAMAALGYVRGLIDATNHCDKE